MCMHQPNRGRNAGLISHRPGQITVYKSFTGSATTDSDHSGPDFSTSLERTKFGVLRNRIDYVMAKITLLN